LSEGLERHADALKDLDRALSLAANANRDWLRGARSLVLVRTGAYRQAVADAWEVGSKPTAGANIVRDAAHTHAIAAAAVLKDAPLAAAERDRLADQYAARAVQLLSRAAARGLFASAAARAALETDAELAPLRSRPDFKKLLADLNKPKNSSR
jgi:eukaryotic-like serine/threonine-protein kinase